MFVVREVRAADWRALRDIRLAALTDAPEAFASTTTGHATAVHLWVNEASTPARRLYQHCGFAPTGERQPLPSNPQLYEVAMIRPL